VPAGYPGKALPTTLSPIVATVELLDQGKLVNLSEYEIFWYQNNHLIEKGKGRYRVQFRPPFAAPEEVTLRVEIPGYANPIIRSVNIPLVLPEVVIEAPLPLLRFRPPTVTVLGVPYFFNATDASLLEFSWAANDTPASTKGDPQALKISVNAGAAPQSTIRVALEVVNLLNSRETASAFITLTTQ
jgi:hypothetical protein